MKKNNKQKNYFIFELLFFVLMFVIIGLLIQQNYKMTQKQKQDTFVVIEKSKKMEMNRCEYKLQNSQGKIIIYNEEFDNYKLGDTIKF
jgi:septal ring-binding cell division protein DamX